MFDFKLKEIIENRLSYLKQNVDELTNIFGVISDDTLNRLKSYLQMRDIRVRLSYPIDQNFSPCFCIRLGTEDEIQRYLSNYGDDDEEYVKTESVTEDLRISEVDGFPVVKTSKRPIYSVESIIYKGETYYDEFIVSDPEHGLISLYFEIDPSVDTLTINYEREVEGAELYGYLAQSTYVIEAWSTNPEETIMLYHIMKWIIQSSYDDLSNIGAFNIKVSGQDLEPVDSFSPNFAFRRGFILTLQYEVTIDQPFNFINKIEVEDDSNYGG